MRLHQPYRTNLSAQTGKCSDMLLSKITRSILRILWMMWWSQRPWNHFPWESLDEWNGEGSVQSQQSFLSVRWQRGFQHNTTYKDRRAKQQVIKTARTSIGSHLPNTGDNSDVRCPDRDQRILEDTKTPKSATVCSHCDPLTRDTEVSAAVYPDYGVPGLVWVLQCNVEFSICPFIQMRTWSLQGLFWAETRPPSKLFGNPFSSFV